MPVDNAQSELPFISVIVPVRNGAGRLERCLSSLQAQTYPPDRFEVIVVDGMSTDDTAGIARRFDARVVPNPQMHLVGGRNAGVEHSRGELFCFTEDDMELPPEWLEAGAQAIQLHDIDCVGGPTPIPPGSGRFAVAVYLFFEWVSRAGYSVQSGYGREGPIDHVPGGNSMYRASTCRQMFPLDSERAEDVHLHLRMRSAGLRIFYSPGFFSWHHKRPNLRQFARQISRFARGRVWLSRQDPNGVRPLHTLVAIATPVFTLLSVAALSVELIPWNIAVNLALLVAFGLAVAGAIQTKDAIVGLYLPLIVAVFPFAWSHGFFAQSIAMWRRRAQPNIYH